VVLNSICTTGVNDDDVVSNNASEELDWGGRSTDILEDFVEDRDMLRFRTFLEIIKPSLLAVAVAVVLVLTLALVLSVGKGAKAFLYA
jgi:hypothetical protein